MVVADGLGNWRQCAVRRRPSAQDVLELVGEVQHESLRLPSISVAFAPAKGQRYEWVIEKLTELGVDRIILLTTDRSVVRWRGERGQKTLARLGLIARQAAAQSRRVWLPTVEPPRTLADLAEQFSKAELCLAEPGYDRPTLRHPAVAVGPEGGWSDRELGLELPRIGLVPSILRAETAAVAAGVTLCSLRAGTVVPGTEGP